MPQTKLKQTKRTHIFIFCVKLNARFQAFDSTCASRVNLMLSDMLSSRNLMVSEMLSNRMRRVAQACTPRSVTHNPRDAVVGACVDVTIAHSRREHPAILP